MTDTSSNTNAQDEEDTGKLLVEIVSALNVPNVDGSGEPDPFVVVCDTKGEILHQTAVLYNAEFPIWSLECGSLFLVDTSQRSIVFLLKEHQRLRSDPTLGTLELEMEELVKCTGQRIEYPLVVPQNIVDMTKSMQSTIVRKVSYSQNCSATFCNILLLIITNRPDWC